MGAKREVVLDGRISPARRRRLNHVSGNGKAALYRHHVATKPPGAIHYSSLSRLDRPYDTPAGGSIPSVRGGLDAPPSHPTGPSRLNASPPTIAAGAGLCGGLCCGGEIAAMSIQSFVKPGEFEPEAIAVMSEAFDAACKALNDTGQPELVLEVMAERIIAAARIGERDRARLREAALGRLLGERD